MAMDLFQGTWTEGCRIFNIDINLQALLPWPGKSDLSRTKRMHTRWPPFAQICQWAEFHPSHIGYV